MASTRTKMTKATKPLRNVSAKEGDLVTVTWMDACASNGWEDHRQAKTKTAHIKSIGWVGSSPDTKTTLVLYADKAHENAEDHDSNRRIAIPKGWITSIKKVRA